MQARVQGLPMDNGYADGTDLQKCVCVQPGGLPCQKPGTDTKSAGACVFPTEGVYLRKLSNRVAAQVQVVQVSEAAYDAREACHSIVGA